MRMQEAKRDGCSPRGVEERQKEWRGWKRGCGGMNADGLQRGKCVCSRLQMGLRINIQQSGVRGGGEGAGRSRDERPGGV